jgi:hypothetical protein
MKNNLLVLLVLTLSLAVTAAFGQVTNTSHGGSFATIQAAVNAAVGDNDVITVDAGSYSATEAVTVNKSVTIQGINGVPTITPSSGIGITITAGSVTLQDLKVTGATGSGIYAANVANLTLTSVESDANGTGVNGSGFDVKGITGTSVFTDLTATGNHKHGLAIGNGSNGVSVSGGTFTGNGQTGDPSTGGGIILYADAGTTTTGVSISGSVASNTNTTAGIYLFCDPTGHVNSTTIGATGTVTLNDNGSNTGAYGAGGAALLVYGPCNGVNVKATSTNNGIITPTAGLVVLGTDASGSNSPSNVTAHDCTLNGYTSTSPAGTMYANSGVNTRICVNDVDATVGNNIFSILNGFDVEDILYHKMDDSQLGLIRGPGTELYVTPSSGSIQRAIDIANNPYSVTQVNVKDGIYTEDVVVNKAIVLNGQGANTIIKPSTGPAVDVTIAGVTLQDLHIYLTAIFTPTTAPTAANNTFTFPVKAKVFLQGPFSAGSMSTALLTGGHIPLSQPYSAAPFSYLGTETVVTVPANVVDWVLVELRSGTAGSTQVAMRACFLKNDGTILETDGTTGVLETVAVATGYDVTSYVVIRHRNHVAIMSAAGVAMPNASAYDFTIAQTQAYGTNPMAVLTGGFGLYCGDTDASGVINLVDRNNTWNNRNATGVYSGSDTDLSGVINLVDRNNTWNNRNITSQVPN